MNMRPSYSTCAFAGTGARSISYGHVRRCVRVFEPVAGLYERGAVFVQRLFRQSGAHQTSC